MNLQLIFYRNYEFDQELYARVSGDVKDIQEIQYTLKQGGGNPKGTIRQRR